MARTQVAPGRTNGCRPVGMKKPKKRTPVPQKPPKVERSKKAYNRKVSKRGLKEILKSVDKDR